MDARQYVAHLLQALGISRCYCGYNMAVDAVLLVLQNEDVLHNIRRQVYVPVAARRNSNWYCVERDMRTVIQRAWQINAELLQQMALYPLEVAPTVKEFIEIVAVYAMRHAPHEVLEEVGQTQMCPV